MAKKNTLNLDTSGIETLITRLEGLGGGVKKAVEDALDQAGETISDDTKEAMNTANLPAGGKYSRGNTLKSIVENPKVTWNGTQAEIPVGFDYSKPGAGGLLITGTPRMKPNAALQTIYKRKTYTSKIQADMAEVVDGYIREKMEG